MPSKSYSKKIVRQLESIANKRARIVIRHILKRGFVTTEELEKKYGYNHPPRAARDVREAGIPLETFRVKSSDGRSIAAYRFGDLSRVRQGKLQGRVAFPKKLKDELYLHQDGKCTICSGKFESRYLQIDHRIPYLVAGDKPDANWIADAFRLLCSSCNRAKSWSCEHCPNGVKDKIPQVCSQCYWASPMNYVHVALREIRRADITWNAEEVQAYERLKKAAQDNQVAIPEFVKNILARTIDSQN